MSAKRTIARMIQKMVAILATATIFSFSQDAVVIGSSFITNLTEYSQALVISAGLTATNKKCQVIGAGMSYIWANCSQTSPIKACEELPKGTHEILYMNAQTPWIKPYKEIGACDSFTRLGMSNPKQRVFIGEYWTFEPPEPRDFFNKDSLPYEAIAMYRRSAIKIAYEVAKARGIPVYIIPTGTAIEHAKDMASAGKLTGYTNRMATMSTDGKHLNGFGHYIQALAFTCGGWQTDIRGLPENVNAFSTTRANADTIQKMVYAVVRTTPFSGFCATDPTDFTQYLSSLKNALRSYEDFDNLVQANQGNGSFTGENGIAWTYMNAKLSYDEWTSNYIQMHTGSILSATLPAGLKEFSFAGRVSSGDAAQVKVYIKESLRSTFTVNSTATVFYYTVRNLDIIGSVPVRLEVTMTQGAAVRFNEIYWKDSGLPVDANYSTRNHRSWKSDNKSPSLYDVAGKKISIGHSSRPGVVVKYSGKATKLQITGFQK